MQICLPIKQKKLNSLLAGLKRAQKQADIIEIWFDEIYDLNEKGLKQISKVNSRPLLYKATKPDFKKIGQILKICKKIAYLDLDITTKGYVIEKIKSIFPKLQIIISYHNFKNTPKNRELRKIIRQMLAQKADILKIATQAKNKTDSFRILALLSQISKEHKSVFLCMGRQGRLTRIAGHLFGNYLMYAPMSTTHKTASGQITVSELRKILKK